MTFEEKLAVALEEEFEERIAGAMTVPEPHKFSLAYRLWEYKALKNFGKNEVNNRWTLSRARYALAASAVAVSVLLSTTVYAVGTMIGRYTFDTKPEYSTLVIDNISSDKTYIEEYYGLPEGDGWEIVDCYADETELRIEYKQNNKNVTFSQRTMIDWIININTEYNQPESVSLYEENDAFFLDYGNGECDIFWIYDGYLFNLSGNFTKNELVNLAYSTRIASF